MEPLNMTTADAVRLIVVSSNLDLVEILLSKQELLTVFQRALNTWSDIPPELLEFSDHISEL